MKVFFFTLLLAFAPAVNAVDSLPLPNLRGIAVGLTDEEPTPAHEAPQAQGIFNLSRPGFSRYGAPCKRSGFQCSTDENATAANKCCNSASMNLTCVKDDRSTSTTLDGKCEESSGDVCHDFYQMKINCDGDNGQADVSKCTNNLAFPADRNCNVMCNYHYSQQAHICSQGSDEDEEEDQ